MNQTQMVRGSTQASWDNVRSVKSAEKTGEDLTAILTEQTRTDQVKLSEGWQSAASYWKVQGEKETAANGIRSPGSFSEHIGLLDRTSGEKDDPIKKMGKKSVISVSRHYTGMASARSKGQVQAVMADIQRSIGDLQMTAVYGETEERVKAGRALRSLKKLLSRGGRKIRRLNQEELAAIRKRNAEKKREDHKAEHARLEKDRHRRGRYGSDQALEMEGRSDEAYIRGYRHYRQLKEEYDIKDTGNITPQGNIENTGLAGPEMGGGQIVVTDTMAF
ncbi:hypothetical protein [Lacrimispora sp.]|uniref:hypothetical protein n=1 Tax=Lacrimispora sp. TaxID=2719234 RepID=UPI0034604034